MNEYKIGLFKTTRRAIEQLLRIELENARSTDRDDKSTRWTLQGLGMLRMYLGEDKSLRLHVWNNRYVFPGSSEMHTHPWHLTSLIVAGVVNQHRFTESVGHGTKPYMRQVIHCGTGGGLIGGPEPVALVQGYRETYHEGDCYSQQADEIHVSSPVPGTVTLVERTFLEDAEHAFVFWQAGQDWVSAEPRPATAYEVAGILRESLERWF